MVALLPLQDCAISTSGDYEHCFIEGGVRYHHLIDPSSGRSPDAVQSVTVLGDDGNGAEAMAKVLFVAGVDKGMRLLESQSGMDAILIDAAGYLHHSRGLQAGAHTH
jgi:thiamine biosynthesis lipoprotein